MAANGTTLKLDSHNFEGEVLESDQPVLVDFWAEWCGPCRMLGPTIEKLAEQYQGRVKVAKLNVDEAADIAGRYGVRSIPTVMLFSGGQIQETFVGVRPQQEYAKVIDGLLA